MRLFLLLFFLPLFVFGENLVDRTDPPLMFYKEPVMKVDPEIQSRWMDGLPALKKEIIRNRRLLDEHQFPLIQAVLVFFAGLALVLIFVFQKSLLNLLKGLFSKSRKPEEISKQELGRLEGMESWSDRYIHLGHVVREYMQNKYQIPAVYQTKEELLFKLSELKTVNRERHENLRHLFDEIERVVYAGGPPDEEEYQKSQKIVEDVINSKL